MHWSGCDAVPARVCLVHGGGSASVTAQFASIAAAGAATTAARRAASRIDIEVTGEGLVNAQNETGPGGLLCATRCSVATFEGERWALEAAPGTDALGYVDPQNSDWTFFDWHGCPGSSTNSRDRASAAGFTFKRIVNDNPYCIVPTRPRTAVVGAEFVRRSKLRVKIEGGGAVDEVNPYASASGFVFKRVWGLDDPPIACRNPGGGVCSRRFRNATDNGTASLRPTPISGWEFVRWSGCDTVEGERCLVDGLRREPHGFRSVAVTAVFRPSPCKTKTLVCRIIASGSIVAHETANGTDGCGKHQVDVTEQLSWGGTIEDGDLGRTSWAATGTDSGHEYCQLVYYGPDCNSVPEQAVAPDFPIQSLGGGVSQVTVVPWRGLTRDCRFHPLDFQQVVSAFTVRFLLRASPRPTFHTLTQRYPLSLDLTCSFNDSGANVNCRIHYTATGTVVLQGYW